jgi:hypothetical protein
MDIMTRPAIFRDELVGETLRRIQPIAMNGRDFVDEWLASNWSDAKRWADSAHLDLLRQIRDEMDEHWKSTTSARPLYTFGPVCACTLSANHFQVELDRDPGAPSFFQIEQGRNSFTMLSVADKADPSCKGLDIMRKP